MATPIQLRLHEWKKSEILLELHGWRSEEGLLFVSNFEGRPQVMQFILPVLSKEDDRPAPTFPKARPIEITEIRLVSPPCRTDQAEANALRATVREGKMPFWPFSGNIAWESARLRYDDEILILKPEDDAALTELLERFKDEKRCEYEARKQELDELLTLLNHRQAIIGRAHYYAHLAFGERGVAEFFLNQERLRLRYDFMEGFLKWTLAEARRHHHIRDPYLHAKWAKQNGLDLQQIAEERKQMSAWVGFVNSGDSFVKQTFGAVFPRFDLNAAKSPATVDSARDFELKFDAAIRFRVTFATGQRVWLTDCLNRESQNASERQEFPPSIIQPVLEAVNEAKLKVEEFKSHIERQAYRDIFVDGNPKENIARSLLQAFLLPRSYREVKVRGGQSDLLLFSKNGKFLYETKIWRGPDYYKQGLRELKEYVIGEGDDPDLKAIFYIIFDPTKSNRAKKYLGKIMSAKVGGRDVDVIVVSLSPPQPSKKTL